MGRFLIGFVLPFLLLIAALLNRSLISLIDLITFLLIQYAAPEIGFQFQWQSLLSWYTLIFSSVTILAHSIFYIVWIVNGDQWSISDAQWAKLIGFERDQSSSFPSVIYFLIVQILAALVALFEIRDSRFGMDSQRDAFWGDLYSFVMQIGSHLRVLCCLLLPAVQLVVGISHPSWASLPFFICSSIGLIDWSLTSNFLGLFRSWRYLLLYAGLNIILLYIYQLPVEYSGIFGWLANFIGLYKISTKSEWSEICSGLSLLVFYVILSWIRCDLIEMDFIMSMRASNLTKQLLPSKHSFFIRESRSGVRHSNILLRGPILRTFGINYFTYGFPISLLALSLWSFHFASLYAFGLLAYVGYILYIFPSMYHLHRLNGLLLVLILLWAVSTYIFNIAFTALNKEKWEDMEIWETIGLWHYPIPGFYLLAQFSLGVLVALSNLVNNSVFLYLSEKDGPSSSDDSTLDDTEETKVLIVATIVYGLRKSSRAMALLLLFLIALNPGLIPALYMAFFLIFLLSQHVGTKIRHCLILLCEAHFTLLYLLQLNLISSTLEKKGSIAEKILSQLGSFKHVNSGDFLKIAVLACCSAIHNHGFEMLLSFSAIVQHTPCPPIGFSILRAGLLKSVILTVYTSRSRKTPTINFSHERKIGLYLNAIGQKFLLIYRPCGAYIVFLTILLTVYVVIPNYSSFGYLFFLLMWITERQLVGKTVKRLWLPLKVYAIAVFVFIYGLSAFSWLQEWLSGLVKLSSAFGYNPEASMLNNICESLAVLIVMQLHSYERRQSENFAPRDDMPKTDSFSFLKRFLIWHSEKILYLAVFYASLSPISALGFSYLFGLVICMVLSKNSQIPSKLLLVYTALLVMIEYPFQMWGYQAEMFPGQKHYSVSFFLGLQVYEPGFFGVESGLRGKVLVIIACILQHNVSQWFEKMPCNFINEGWLQDSCDLFIATEIASNEATVFTRGKFLDVNLLLSKMKNTRSYSCPSLKTSFSRGMDPVGGIEGRNYTNRRSQESSYNNLRWKRKQIHVLKKERLAMQKASLKVYIKFWVENMFNLFGLEINMIALLLASFSVLNAISLLYIASLAACILLPRDIISKLWLLFVFLFASVITLEYMAFFLNLTSWMHLYPTKAEVLCDDCWRSSHIHFDYCQKCWLGLAVDHPRMLISYYAVFMFSCLKLHADRLSSLSGFQTYKQMMFHSKEVSGLSDLSFETKVLWTFLDYLRLYSYCHLLDLVLALILITGTLEYDILHLGYLGFALVFFRIRLQILKKKNSIFKFLRIYNFALIVLSLAYQSPFLGGFCEGECEIDQINKVIGLHKYGFQVTSRFALVEVIIFILISLQSYMFSSLEFDYVSKYIEAEKIGALVREQEKKAAWKTAHLQQIRKSEEQKRMRNLQVEKIKSEMLNLLIQLQSMSTINCGNTFPESKIKRNQNFSVNSNLSQTAPEKRDADLSFTYDMNGSPISERTGVLSVEDSRQQSIDSMFEINELQDTVNDNTFLNSHTRPQEKYVGKRSQLASAVQLIGDGVSQMQSLGSMAVMNLVNLLNIEHEKEDLSDNSSDDEVYYEVENDFGIEHVEKTHSMVSDTDRNRFNVSRWQIRIILHHIWEQMRSNNNVVCYCCFILIFLWNFSLLSMVYLVGLFLYALCVNTGPSHMFWVIMLIYTEVCILLQYLYQIIIQHFGMIFEAGLIRDLGFPSFKNMSSFVIIHWPLFLVYLFTLLQYAITTNDGEWTAAAEFSFTTESQYQDTAAYDFGFIKRIKRLLLRIRNTTEVLIRNLYRYWISLTQESETPPYFVQLSMEVNSPSGDGIQPETIESKMNKLLQILHDRRCRDNLNMYPASRVRVQSIERSPENFNVALVVFEVLYASPSEGSSVKEWQRSLTPSADVTSEILEAYHADIFREIQFPYTILSVIGGGKKQIDLYAYVFCADLVVFFLVAIFYQSVIKNNSEFLEVYQHEDQFPKEFVFILMVIFFLIVLDRIIYLCSFATAKVIFYLFTLFLFTYSVTNYAWQMVPLDRHAGKFALRAIYLTKLISLALQAIQIRFGIPHESSLYRQFLTSSISQTNYLGFRIYRALPFLYELRCVLDWSCTTTSLTMYDWLKLEDIYGSLFLVKCDVDLNRAKHQQGKKQTKLTKFCSGICLFFILICVIWAPMLMYSSGNPTNIANPIREASVQVDIETSSGKLTLFETTLCERISWNKVKHKHLDLDPQGYLDNYNEVDIQLICCQADASKVWLVPPVVQSRFIESLHRSMGIIFSWQFMRNRPKGKEVVKHQLLVEDDDLPTPAEVMQVLNGTANSFRIFNIYPKYFRVTGSGDLRFLEQSVDKVSGDLILNHGNPEWWSFKDIDVSSGTGCCDFAGPMAIIVSEETPQGILGDTLSKFSIWGLYITFVLAVGRFIRLQCSDLRMRIQFENLPSCDRLLAICEDIYAARAEGELEVEDVLYWTLVSIYRSPHMLLQYTKPD
ncbi:piezo-type mechanosensitive ion channel homolog isoform X1 [Hibiscus syriacus]|uniref:piezo-type mechanosensitive ion channel homolog isoform X1 n=1 Tax=Hibiscus syriacus TaxID=106335 RepID=UPI001921D1C6|nr:piezo-type mechanosensitive ion channel homolog isoform X1 [Hibiscus syriacus]